MTESNKNTTDLSTKQRGAGSTYQRWRKIKDSLVRYSVVAGGMGVIVAIVLIFFYLLYVVFPLFLPAEAKSLADYALPDAAAGKTWQLAMEEQNEVAVRFTDQGKAVFFAVATGRVIKTEMIEIPENTAISSFASAGSIDGSVVYGLSDGRAILVKQKYKISYQNNKRSIDPELEFPLGRDPLVLDKAGKPLLKVAVKNAEDMTTFAAITADGRKLLIRFEKEESLFDDDLSLERSDAQLQLSGVDIDYILIDKEQRNLYMATRAGQLSYIDISNFSAPVIKQTLNIISVGLRLTALEFLNGDLSLLAADSRGKIGQWSLVRNEQNRSELKQIRAFSSGHKAVLAIDSEQRRKGFLIVDAEGNYTVFHSTSERKLLQAKVTAATPVALALSPRANAFLLEDADGKVHYWQIKNEHPEVSIKSLWEKVWYESYQQPEYIWQSSSASNDFEPKFSLTPLVFGTLKAAFYAMLVAMPLAIMGAIYTAYFMAPRLRRIVKPSIEIMEALPTVILGFLAGLWLAPMIEEHLMAIFSLFLLVPLGVLVFAFCWQLLPNKIMAKISPDGWHAALLIPIIIFCTWLAFALAGPIQELLFDGDLRVWLTRSLGVSYDQRNSLVVGLAMGFAVIPTIFSITEDAIFSVPKYLTYGSLALGATPWQTMLKVVLLTASPGIFSAVMIGFGRAIGETMIVLMATGNTPVMDLSIFQGMRTLAANIAVEMPEAEVDSTHYRVLFLAALILFLFTFVFNTLAEVIRQRLREKYSSL